MFLSQETEVPISKVISTQCRVIHALMLREVYTRFGRDNIGFAWIIVEPALFALFVVALWSIIGHGNAHKSIPLIPFLFTGYMPLLMYRHMVARLLRCMQANSGLLYHRQITIFSLYASRCLVEFLGTSSAFLFCMTIFWFLGFVDTPDNLSELLGGWFLYAWYSVATSMSAGALSERSELVEKLWNPISYIMIPLSGTFFMVDWIPPAFREYALLSPPINGVEMIRAGYFGPSVTTVYNISYFAAVNATITVLGLYLLSDARRYVEIE